MKIRTILVDDEPLAREGIRNFLDPEKDVEIVAECRNGEEAVTAIRAHRPDLLLLDVQMPEMDGFAVLNALDTSEIPVVVFVTAYDRYALDAFQAHALDYLLKPLDPNRFRETLARARQQVQYRKSGQVSDEILKLLGDLGAQEEWLDRLMIKDRGRVFFVKVNDIDWIQAAGNYVRLHVGDERYLMRETMSNLGARLNPKQFVLIHRSTVVNLERVKEIQPYFQGEHVVVLENGGQLTLSRTYRDKLQEKLGGGL